MKKVETYRDDYRRPGRSDRSKAFLLAIMSTSGRIQGELLRLLFIISHRQVQEYFARLREDPSTQAFTTRRGTYFSHNRASIGLACAQTIAAQAYLPSLNHYTADPLPLHLKALLTAFPLSPPLTTCSALVISAIRYALDMRRR